MQEWKVACGYLQLHHVYHSTFHAESPQGLRRPPQLSPAATAGVFPTIMVRGLKLNRWDDPDRSRLAAGFVEPVDDVSYLVHFWELKEVVLDGIVRIDQKTNYHGKTLVKAQE